MRHIERESEREVQSQSIDYNQMKHSSESRRRIRDLPTKKPKNRFNKKILHAAEGGWRYFFQIWVE